MEVGHQDHARRGECSGSINRIRADFQPLSVKEGPITGTLKGSQLSLRWADGEKERLPFKFYMEILGGDQHVTGGTLEVDTPWPGSAEVRAQGNTQVAVWRDEMREGNETTIGYWSAYRLDDSWSVTR